MSQFIRFLLSFFMFYAVDPGDTGGADGDQSGVVDDDSGGEGEGGQVEDAGEAAWNAIQEGDEGDAAPGETVGDAVAGEEAGTDGDQSGGNADEAAAAAAKDDSSAITEDDLKPLEGAKAKTQERFQKVTDGYKAEKERADKLAEEVNNYKQSFDSLRQLGFNDEAAAADLVEFSAYRGVLASGDEKQFAEIINAQIKQFQVMHGKQVHIGGSIIADHADLLAKVENMELDEPTAIEVARVRNLQERANRESERQNQMRDENQRSEQAIQNGAAAVAALENEWRKSDTDFPAILPLLQEQLPEIAKAFPPNQWEAQFKLQYQAIKKAMATVGTQSRQSSPLRGGNHMSASRQPSNMQEAVLLEMGME